MDLTMRLVIVVLLLLLFILMIVFNPWVWSVVVSLDKPDLHDFVRLVKNYLRSEEYVKVMLSGHSLAAILGLMIAWDNSSWKFAVVTTALVLASLFSIIFFAIGMGVANAR